MKTKEIRHYLPDYFHNLSHPVSVMIVGLGGTGCIVAANLLRIHTTLKALGHRGLQVALFDHDIITEANRGRQMFYHDDIGKNKAFVMAQRLNTAAGEYVFFPHARHVHKSIFSGVINNFSYSRKTLAEHPNIIMSCVDNIDTRKDLQWRMREHRSNSVNGAAEFVTWYWMDFGNDLNTGQVILGSKLIKQKESELYITRAKLPTAIDMMPDAISRVKEDDTPSCSIQEAIGKQDLFINPIVADQGCHMLWQLLRQGYTNYNAVFINLESGEIKRNTLV